MNNEFISIMTERIAQGFDPFRIILFGSQARGDTDQQSDIDLLVVFAELRDKRKTTVDIRIVMTDLPVAKGILVPTSEESKSPHIKRIGPALCQRTGKDARQVAIDSLTCTPAILC